jgi:signal transduction histidine kinase
LAYFKRSTFLVNKNFQLRVSLIVSSLTFLSSLIFPIMFIDFLDELTVHYPDMVNMVHDFKAHLVIIMLPIQIVLTGTVFLVMIFVTHKIAGPMLKLQNHLSSIRDGDAASPLSFRQGDYFSEVADEVSLFLESVQQKQEEDFEYVVEVKNYIDNLSGIIPDDKRPILNEISRRLEEIRNRYKKDL